jgi:hypothetical protein
MKVTADTFILLVIAVEIALVYARLGKKQAA